MPPIRPRPFQIGFHEDKARRPCKSPAALQGLNGIGIPSRKTQALHSGQPCSFRGKSGGGRSGGEPYRRIGQTFGLSKSRRALRVCSRLCAFLFFSLVRLLIAAVSSSRNDFAKHEVRCLHVLRRERQRFSGLQKIGMPWSPVPYTQVSGNQEAHFLAEGFYI